MTKATTETLDRVEQEARSAFRDTCESGMPVEEVAEALPGLDVGHE